MTTFAKTSKEAFKFYKTWEKALLAADIKLPAGHRKVMLVAYCLTMAVHGTNGIECYAGDATIAEELDIYNRRDISKYRHLAVDLGWFVPSGKKRGRAEALDIAIPTPSDEYRVPDEAVRPGTVEHDEYRFPEDCPACRAKWPVDPESGMMSKEAFDEHSKAIQGIPEDEPKTLPKDDPWLKGVL